MVFYGHTWMSNLHARMFHIACYYHLKSFKGGTISYHYAGGSGKGITRDSVTPYEQSSKKTQRGSCLCPPPTQIINGRPLTVYKYILWSTSPPTSQYCSRQKKKVDIQEFFYFFLRHSKKLGGFFFTKSVAFLLRGTVGIWRTLF